MKATSIVRLKNDRVKMYHSVRTAHLERVQEFAAASIIYRVRSYDFDDHLARELDVIRAGTVRSIVLLLASRPSSIEINEPLMAESAINTAMVIAALKRLTPARVRPKIVSYAIENKYPFSRRPATAKGRLKVLVQERAAVYIWRNLDRVAFGTAGARAVYLSAFPQRAVKEPATKVITALPAPCSCVGTAVHHDVVFLGSLSDRKGFPLLQASWTSVVEADPSATLTILGKGPLEEVAETWSRTVDGVTFYKDPTRRTIHEVLRAARVLVLLSQPSTNWREQVGLPIVEGLAHGCRIVTTAETGLAEWLAEYGHAVLDASESPAVVGRAIADQREMAPPDDSALPRTDGRLRADRWLLEA